MVLEFVKRYVFHNIFIVLNKIITSRDFASHVSPLQIIIDGCEDPSTEAAILFVK